MANRAGGGLVKYLPPSCPPIPADAKGTQGQHERQRTADYLPSIWGRVDLQPAPYVSKACTS